MGHRLGCGIHAEKVYFFGGYMQVLCEKSGSAFTLSHFNMKKSVKGVVYVKKK